MVIERYWVKYCKCHFIFKNLIQRWFSLQISGYTLCYHQRNEQECRVRS